jgi:hypothetical protein
MQKSQCFTRSFSWIERGPKCGNCGQRVVFLNVILSIIAQEPIGDVREAGTDTEAHSE